MATLARFPEEFLGIIERGAFDPFSDDGTEGTFAGDDDNGCNGGNGVLEVTGVFPVTPVRDCGCDGGGGVCASTFSIKSLTMPGGGREGEACSASISSSESSKSIMVATPCGIVDGLSFIDETGVTNGSDACEGVSLRGGEAAGITATGADSTTGSTGFDSQDAGAASTGVSEVGTVEVGAVVTGALDGGSLAAKSSKSISDGTEEVDTGAAVEDGARGLEEETGAFGADETGTEVEVAGIGEEDGVGTGVFAVTETTGV